MAEEPKVDMESMLGGMGGGAGEGEGGEGGGAPGGMDMNALMQMMGKGGGKGGGEGEGDEEGGMGGMDMNALMQMMGKGGGKGDGGKGGMGGMGGKGGGGGKGEKDDSEKAGGDGKWHWQQKGEEVHVRIPKTDAPLTKKDIKVTFKRASLQVVVCGETVIDGKLGGTVEVDECTWVIAPDKTELQVMLTKQDESAEWASLLA